MTLSNIPKKTKTIEILEHISIRKTVEITFPYYFRKLGGTDICDTTYYGKITEAKIFVICKKDSLPRHDSIIFEIEKQGYIYTQQLDTTYFKHENRSTEKEFLEIKAEALKFINDESKSNE